PGVLLALLPLSLGFTVVRDADTLAPIRWPASTVTVVAQEDGSADVTDGSDLTAIQAAVAAWTAPCSDLSLVYGGAVASGADANDGTNRIAFRESNWPGGMNGAAATTVRRRDTGGSPDTWSDVDILLNGQHFS